MYFIWKVKNRMLNAISREKIYEVVNLRRIFQINDFEGKLSNGSLMNSQQLGNNLFKLTVGYSKSFFVIQWYLSRFNSGRLHQLYLHFFDKILVLAKSLQGKHIKMTSFTLSERLLSTFGNKLWQHFLSLGDIIYQ